MTVTGEDGGPAALGLPLTLRGTPASSCWKESVIFQCVLGSLKVVTDIP